MTASATLHHHVAVMFWKSDDGMAAVYQGYQASLDRYVAIKVMRSVLQDDPEFAKFKNDAINTYSNPQLYNPAFFMPYLNQEQILNLGTMPYLV